MLPAPCSVPAGLMGRTPLGGVLPMRPTACVGERSLDMKQKQRPLLTVGIIFKNEIRCLERCLKSLAPLREAIPCEVVMADTGSDDGSYEIAEKYADILFKFPWINDFAAARNAVLDRSSGKWFMTLDSDEWLDPDIREMVQFLQLGGGGHNFAGFTIRNFKLPDIMDDDYQDFYAMRIMRSGIGVRYEGCIHEHWKYPETIKNPQVVRLDTVVYHDGYAFASKEAMKAKQERNMELLRKKLEEDPDDLQTLAESMDVTKTTDDISVEYAHRALKVLHQDWERWGPYGSRIYRDVVTVAQLRKQPELLEWAEKAVELYPDSIYVRVDVAYCAYARSWDKKDIPEAVRWAEMYRGGLEDYRTGNFNRSELFRGQLEFGSPHWERRLLIMQVEGYLELSQHENAFSTFECIDGASLDEAEQVEACVNMLLRIHRETELDTASLMGRFWDQINQPLPDEAMEKKRRKAFLQTAAASLTPYYRSDETTRNTFVRHSYTALLPLEGRCVLGDGAAILEETEPEVLETRLARGDVEDLPIAALAHALKCGARFPMPKSPLRMETMDALAGRLGPFGGLFELAGSTSEENLQSLYWKRALLLAAIRSCDWKDEENGLELVNAYVALERQFLAGYYTDALLSEAGAYLLPPAHRFGFYCVRAFDAMHGEDTVGYVRLLRLGLDSCKEMKEMVEFLLSHMEKMQSLSAPPELKALADQVRVILARFDSNDPAVAALKASEAYQKVAYLIEGFAVPVRGGMAQ